MAPSNAADQLTAARAYPLLVQGIPYPTPSEGEVIVKVAATAVDSMDWAIQSLVEVGAGDTKFKAGDRVAGLNAAFNSRSGAYQNYCALEAKITCPIRDDLSFTDAAVLPLGLGTAAPAFADTVGLNGKTLLVWASSTSVGSNAVQLAVAADCEVITTASPKNFEYYKKLGASQPVSVDVIFEVVAKSDGAKFVASAPPIPEKLPEGIQAKMVCGGSLKDIEVGTVIFDQYLPATLAKKQYHCTPIDIVAWDKMKNESVSATKLPITL
ncbi:GroES-like protein [Xylaria longipes]|nr:GroES-like protein [Xylaria longipes]